MKSRGFLKQNKKIAHPGGVLTALVVLLLLLGINVPFAWPYRLRTVQLLIVHSLASFVRTQRAAENSNNNNNYKE